MAKVDHIFGIIADSHGEVGRTRAAVRLLKEKGATAFIFLGDAETTAVLDSFNGLRTWVVFGNCDDDYELAEHARSIGLEVVHPLGQLQIDGQLLAFTHGHLDECISTAFTSGAAYLLHGHTHRRRDDRIGETRVINPGALARAHPATAAVLDVFADELSFVEVPL